MNQTVCCPSVYCPSKKSGSSVRVSEQSLKLSGFPPPEMEAAFQRECDEMDKKIAEAYVENAGEIIGW